MSMFLQQPKQSRPQRYSISLPLEIPKNGDFIRSIAPYIPAFGTPALLHLLRSKERARTLQAELPPTSSSFCPHFTNSFCEQMKRLRPKKKDRPAEEKRHSSAGRKIFVRMKICFCAHRNLSLRIRRLNPLHNKQLRKALKTTSLPPACSSERGSK